MFDIFCNSISVIVSHTHTTSHLKSGPAEEIIKTKIKNSKQLSLLCNWPVHQCTSVKTITMRHIKKNIKTILVTSIKL